MITDKIYKEAGFVWPLFVVIVIPAKAGIHQTALALIKSMPLKVQGIFSRGVIALHS